MGIYIKSSKHSDRLISRITGAAYSLKITDILHFYKVLVVFGYAVQIHKNFKTVGCFSIFRPTYRLNVQVKFTSQVYFTSHLFKGWVIKML